MKQMSGVINGTVEAVPVVNIMAAGLDAYMGVTEALKANAACYSAIY